MCEPIKVMLLSKVNDVHVGVHTKCNYSNYNHLMSSSQNRDNYYNIECIFIL